MKNIFIITILVVVSLGFQEEKKDLILSSWRFEKEYDLRTEKEKEGYFTVMRHHELWDYSHDKIFIKGGEYIELHKNGIVECGLWKIENDSLKLSIKVTIGYDEKLLENSVMKANIKLESDGCYYLFRDNRPIKSLTQNQLELGSTNLYDKYVRIE